MEKSELQQQYCESNSFPLFAPKNGICYHCHKNIYDLISEEKAGHELITGCPHCHKSYCD